MALSELLPTDISGAAVWLVILLSLVQIAPIKLDPWSWLARSFGKAINGDLMAEVRELRADFDITQAGQARKRILRFNDELLRHELHSKEFFDDVLEDVDAYERYCEEHPKYRNSKAVLAISNIRRCYEKCEADGDFLK